MHWSAGDVQTRAQCWSAVQRGCRLRPWTTTTTTFQGVENEGWTHESYNCKLKVTNCWTILSPVHNFNHVHIFLNIQSQLTNYLYVNMCVWIVDALFDYSLCERLELTCNASMIPTQTPTAKPLITPATIETYFWVGNWRLSRDTSKCSVVLSTRDGNSSLCCGMAAIRGTRSGMAVTAGSFALNCESTNARIHSKYHEAFMAVAKQFRAYKLMYKRQDYT